MQIKQSVAALPSDAPKNRKEDKRPTKRAKSDHGSKKKPTRYVLLGGQVVRRNADSSQGNEGAGRNPYSMPSEHHLLHAEVEIPEVIPGVSVSSPQNHLDPLTSGSSINIRDILSHPSNKFLPEWPERKPWPDRWRLQVRLFSFR